MTFKNWLQRNWEALCLGRKIEIDLRTDPQSIGFQKLGLAEPNGQREDWALRLEDGSRLHLWVMPDGRHIVHRDRYDPAAGLSSMLQHFFSETALGGAVVAGLLVVGVTRLLSAAR
ncbi:MAG: hypothetical protein IPI49_19645 [Myxococcales bacterium]|nr:hypothetical protein [Myxococcales bacterium]